MSFDYLNHSYITCSWNNIPINQSELTDKFTGNVNLSLGASAHLLFKCIHYLGDTLWVGLGLGVGIGLVLYFWTIMLIKEHDLLGKITVTE